LRNPKKLETLKLIINRKKLTV